MEFNTKLSKLIARRKVIETFYNGLNVLYNFDVIINDKGKVILE